MTMRNTTNYTLDSLTANGEATQMINCVDYRNAIITVEAANSANLTIKFYGSTMKLGEQPDLTDTASLSTNEYSPIECVNLDTGIRVDGSTGITFDGSSDGISKYEINVNGLNFIGVKVTAYTAGDLAIKANLYDNS